MAEGVRLMSLLLRHGRVKKRKEYLFVNIGIDLIPGFFVFLD